MQYSFDRNHPYFVFDPDGDGMTYFRTIEERDRHAAECIQEAAEGTEWSDGIVFITAGVVTHSATQINPTHFGPDEYVCDYKMTPLSGKEQ